MIDKDSKNRKENQRLKDSKGFMCDFQKKIDKALSYNPSKDVRDPKYKK